ncbi:cell division protein FtsQ/DivIB [Wohlfahrtiimonas larvae]|uniref:Cell division protein FtsQ/DivIB n=1 Tax=Wohlfahrtiimonas larvae TaxID=1157986 RepID=A0ABP9MSQ0_9GAMM|nr:cell division protein FtsQ/DivIB [Wohlfahrtiimonas larvae]
MKQAKAKPVRQKKRTDKNNEQIIGATSWSRRRKRGVRHKKPFDWKIFGAKSWHYCRYTFRILLLVSLFLIPYMGWQYISLNNVFPIQHVLIHSEEKYLVDERKQKLLEPLLGQNFVSYDLEKYRSEVAQNPWVKSVEVMRHWPDQIDLFIQERRPIAIWNDLYLIEADGTIFEPDLIPSEAMISLQGNLDQKDKLLDGMTVIQKSIQSVGLNVEKIILDYRGAWTIVLENDVELYLGARFFEERLRRFVMHYPSSIRSKIGSITAIDFRYDHGYALKWKR